VIEVVEKHSETVTFRVTARKAGVYLDNWAVVALAKDRGDLRDRFLQSLRNGADLLFSETNASEIVGPTGASHDAVRDFLTAIGPYWMPVAGTGIVKVMEREAAGDGRESCIDHSLLQRFYAGRSIQLYGEQRLDFTPPGFFDLGFFLDWLVPRRAEIVRSYDHFDVTLRAQLRELRRGYEQNKSRFESVLPSPVYDATAPLTFCWNGVIRLLVLEGKAYQWKRGDSADFFHALLAASYSQVATLDKQWKRRIEALPKPNSLASIYYQPELTQFVKAVEAAVSASPHLRHPLAATAHGLG
jgi:hypothetical protein